MSNKELDIELDILFNNISSNQAPGLNIYEKSVLLTKAQEELIKNYFNPKGNKYIEGFDGDEKRQTDFSSLIVVSPLSSISQSIISINPKSFIFAAPNNLLFSLNERLIDTSTNKEYTVKPLSYKEYERLSDKPYCLPLKRQAWRLITNYNNSPIYEVIANIPKDHTVSYRIRYVRTPRPIVLENLDGDYSGLSINGVTTATECELPAHLHREILQRAVELAKISFDGGASNIIESGVRAE